MEESGRGFSSSMIPISRFLRREADSENKEELKKEKASSRIEIIFLGKRPRNDQFENFLYSLEKGIKDGYFFNGRFSDKEEVSFIFKPNISRKNLKFKTVLDLSKGKSSENVIFIHFGSLKQGFKKEMRSQAKSIREHNEDESAEQLVPVESIMYSVACASKYRMRHNDSFSYRKVSHYINNGCPRTSVRLFDPSEFTNFGLTA